MTRRRYSSAASETALTNSINNSVTAIVLDAVTGFPGSFPYELIIDYGNASEECVLVTAGTGTSLTVTRGYDGTTGLPHAAGATVIHGVSAIDFDEANAHVNSTTGVHGVSGAMVGTTDAQPLTNKDLSSGTNTFPAALATDVEVASAIAAAIATMPKGTLGYAQVTALQSGITTAVDLAGLSVAITAGTGRRLRITGFAAQVFSTVTGDVIGMTINEGATQLNAGFTTSTTGGLQGWNIAAQAVITPTPGAHTYKLQMVRASGTGSITMTATATSPAFILVEDIGV